MPAIDIFGLCDGTRQFFLPVVRRRQKIILRYTTEDYSFRIKGSKNAAMKELAEQGLESSDSSVDGYVAQYLIVYIYSKGEDQKRIEEINTLLEKNSKRTKPLQILLNNGITTWQQILDLEEDWKMREEILRAAELAAGITAGSDQGIALVSQPVCETIAEAVQTILNETVRLTDRISCLEGENRVLAEHEEDYVATIKQLNAQIASKDHQIREMEAAKEYTAARMLENIAFDYPTLIDKLLKCAEEIRELGNKRKALPEELPKKAIWNGNPGNTESPKEIDIVYQENFLDFYRQTQDNVCTQIVKQIGFLCSRGPNYSSLDTHPIGDNRFYNSPNDALYSKVNDVGVRFTWIFDSNAKKLTIYDAGIEGNVTIIKRTHTKHR